MSDDLQTSDSPADAPPLRIATVGLSANAVFHLEAAAIRDGKQFVAAARTDDREASTEPVPRCSVCSLDELAERSDVDAVFVCGPVERRIDHAIRFLQSGKHVFVESSANLQPDQLQRLIAEAESCQKSCEVWRPFNADPDFRRAAKLVASEEAGPVRSVRFIQHDMSAALLPGANSPHSRDRLAESTLRDSAGHRIAQALTLIGAPVKTITARFHQDSVRFADGESAQRITPAGETTFHAVIEFENDATALIDIGLACPVPFSSGWIVQGDQGGYHSDRQYITVDDGEIYDVAVEVQPFNPYLNLHSVLSNWSKPELQKQCLERLRSELELAQVLQKFL
jgi:predicted dehydrogenase